jgi:hypothetical protein
MRHKKGPTREADKIAVTMEPDLFEELIQSSRKALHGSHYNVAYHALAAALHYAQDEENIESLLLVAHIADEQLKWIDATTPDYEHSSRSSQRRGAPNIYQSLTRQANTGVTLIKSIRATRTAAHNEKSKQG